MAASVMRTSDVVSCQQCQNRKKIIDMGKRFEFRPSDLFVIAGYAEDRGGHAIYYSVDGPTTLCTARQLKLPTYIRA